MYQTERTLVDTATNENFSSRNSAFSLDNKCSTNTPPPAPQFLDPTAVHDDEDCVRQTADPTVRVKLKMTWEPQRAITCNRITSWSCATQNLLPATLHEWPPQRLHPVASRHSSRQRHEKTSRFDHGIFRPRPCHPSQGPSGRAILDAAANSDQFQRAHALRKDAEKGYSTPDRRGQRHRHFRWHDFALRSNC